MKDTLNETTKRIVEEADPDKIILFGSRAKGEAKKESDYDICVLKEVLLINLFFSRKDFTQPPPAQNKTSSISLFPVRA